MLPVDVIVGRVDGAGVGRGGGVAVAVVAAAAEREHWVVGVDLDGLSMRFGLHSNVLEAGFSNNINL